MPDHPPASAAGPRLDFLLRFRDDIDALHERETSQARLAELTRSSLFCLLLYNFYSLTCVFLVPDVLAAALIARAFIVTPGSLMLVWLIHKVDPARREQLVMLGSCFGVAQPVLFFWLSAAPLSPYTFGELPLMLVFGNMLLVLRFRHACIFTFATFIVTLLALGFRSGLDPSLAAALVMNIAAACIMSLYANWHAESARCRAYLVELDARGEAEEANLHRSYFENLSLTDALTGLPNRRALQNRLDVWFTEAQPVSVLMVDVDHFKPFNDRLGHAAGDECLKKIAACLCETAGRAGAFAARYGGEEFTAVLHNGSEMESARLARDLIEAIRLLELPHPGRPDGNPRVSVSVGLARTPSGLDASAGDMLEAADNALYIAKMRGRDQWARYGDKIVESPVQRAS
jgi:diguanylate cyclase (GGDEF)-like protein